jgi:hypothetical protein
MWAAEHLIKNGEKATRTKLLELVSIAYKPSFSHNMECALNKALHMVNRNSSTGTATYL